MLNLNLSFVCFWIKVSLVLCIIWTCQTNDNINTTDDAEAETNNVVRQKFTNKEKTLVVGYLIDDRIGNWSIFKDSPETYRKKTISSTKRVTEDEDFDIEFSKVYLKRQIIECLYSHNVIRKRHGLKPLLWDENLAYRAEEWAMVLAERDGGIIHTAQPDRNGFYFGENIYEGPMDENGGECSRAVIRWYREIDYFNFKNPSYNSEVGHFTQLVWPSTKYVGVGISYVRQNMYIVANYLQGETYSNNLTFIKQPAKNVNMLRLVPSEKPTSLTIQFNVPDEGGWTTWEETTSCSLTCGDGGVIMERRYCIRTNATTSDEPYACGDGPVQRMVPCSKPACPTTEQSQSMQCNDFSNNCQEFIQKNITCKGIDSVEYMKENCKSTCNFCRPCKDRNGDCSAYSNAPYNYCTNNEYSEWMLVNCAKACGYCEQNVTTVYNSDCRDFDDNCETFAREKHYCMSAEYAEYMKVNCKESCKFCQPCTDAFEYCKQMKDDYGYCTNDNASDWMRLRCPDTCGYCYNPNVSANATSTSSYAVPQVS